MLKSQAKVRNSGFETDSKSAQNRPKSDPICLCFAVFLTKFERFIEKVEKFCYVLLSHRKHEILQKFFFIGGPK
jgi:hypothetical protein